jgi:hypothetical protein
MLDLRKVIGTAIVSRFQESYEKHGTSYDPDTCWEAADDVAAALVEALTGQECNVLRYSAYIGTLGFELGPPSE